MSPVGIDTGKGLSQLQGANKCFNNLKIRGLGFVWQLRKKRKNNIFKLIRDVNTHRDTTNLSNAYITYVNYISKFLYCMTILIR